jgi:hypothetical protein
VGNGKGWGPVVSIDLSLTRCLKPRIIMKLKASSEYIYIYREREREREREKAAAVAKISSL